MDNTFLRSNETKYRLARTILQGVIGVLIANLDLLISGLTIPPQYKPMIVALVMAVLSPIMSELGGKSTNAVEAEEPEQDTFNEDNFLTMMDDVEEVAEDEKQDNTAE